MDKHTCPLRGLIICDGLRCYIDALRPLETAPCFCEELDLVDEGTPRWFELRWLRARTVARSPRLQRLMERRRKLDDWPPF